LETLQTEEQYTVGLVYEEAGDLSEDELFDLAIETLAPPPLPKTFLTHRAFREREEARTGRPCGRDQAATYLNNLVKNHGWKKRRTHAFGWIYWREDETGQEDQTQGPGNGGGDEYRE